MRAMVRLFVVAFVCLITCAPLLADSGWARSKRIFVVPRPGPVTIDGRLDDWDLSARLWTYITLERAEITSAHTALMYDDEALYIAGDVKDPTPMMNRHDPRVDPHKGWDADSFQFRIVLDASQGWPVRGNKSDGTHNDQLCHMLLWYYTDRQEPCLQIMYGMDYRPPKHGNERGMIPAEKFQAAYRAHDDGKGYTFEYRIPWSTLDARKPPTGGDVVAATLQYNWSRPDGLATSGEWAYDVMARPSFPYQNSDCWGKAIFSPTGNIPRELVEEGLPPVKPMPLTIEYEMPEPGEVTLALVDEQNIIVRYLLASAARQAGRHVEKWDGLDASGVPLPAGTYRLRGLYHQPIKTKFVLSVHNSGNPPYKTDDGKGGWGGDHGEVQDCLHVDGSMLLAWDVCESGWGIIRTDLNGKKRWGSKLTATYLASDGKRIFAAGGRGFSVTGGVIVMDIADSRPLSFGNGKAEIRAEFSDANATRNEVTGLLYHGGKIYASYRQRDKIAVFDAASGDFIETIDVPAPGRLAATRDGTLLVAGSDAVLAVQGGTARPLIAEHIDAPVSVAVDSKGEIYVANRGKLQNISVFSADGTYLRSIGKPGGRLRVGRYDGAGILEPGGISIDAQGNLWVAETLDSPKRVSVWNTQTGELVNEFFGASAYATPVQMDPKHPDELFCHSVLWKIDLDAGTHRPYSTVWRPSDENSPECPLHFYPFTASNGRQYAFGNLYAKGPVLMVRDGDIYKPVQHMFLSTPEIEATRPELWPPYPLAGDPQAYPSATYVWVDANRDQVMQPEEITRQPKELFRKHWTWVDENLNLWSGDGYVWKPLRIEDDGTPVYDFANPTPTGIYGNNRHGALFTDPAGTAIFTNAPGAPGRQNTLGQPRPSAPAKPGEKLPPAPIPASVGGDYPGLARWDADGKLAWGLRGIIGWQSALNRPVTKPGEIFGPTSILGLAGEFTGVGTYFGPYHVLTADGLYVAKVFRDIREHGGMGPDIIGCESFSGQLVKPERMNRYFLLAGDQDGRVTEILGLDTVKRLPERTLTLTPEDVQTVARAFADYAAQKTRAQKLTIVRNGRAALADAPAIEKTLEDGRAFSVQASYDAQNLYFRYTVDGPSELINAISDDRLIFKGGNVIDLQFACDPSADPKRQTPAPGDIRILVTRRAGKPVAVIYRPKVAGFDGEPIVLASPTGKESFDSIGLLESVKLDYTIRPGGFVAIVTIPLESIGLKLVPGQALPLDVGYIFGNAHGTAASIRSYWTNNSFTANVLNDVPHESRLEPSQWGSAEIE
jgi:outer membrane protein assembly factor BamB